MSLVLRLIKDNTRILSCSQRLLTSYSTAPEKDEEPQEFRVLNLKTVKVQHKQKKKFNLTVLPPRETQMPVDQEWSNVWPGPKTFHPASVPLPIRQGMNEKGAPPGKYANAELMKIPNFLHLTPPAIRKHCTALAQFCTKWPENLDTEKSEAFFPLKVIYSDYCHSSPTIRDPMSRIVSLKVRLSSLKLDARALDKFRRLVGERYNEKTDEITLVTDRCPTKKQNYDYAMYLLTALYHESLVREPWEVEKTEDDMEYYDWEKSSSKSAVSDIIFWGNQESKTEDVGSVPYVIEYKDVVTDLRDKGSDDQRLDKYGEVTRKLLNLPSCI